MSGMTYLVNPVKWKKTSLSSESSLHQIAPYIGKMKSAMSKTLIEAYTKPGDIVLDPFVGSGTVGLECLIAGREFIGVDINPYAIVLTKAKLFPPPTLDEALSKANKYLSRIDSYYNKISLEDVPDWVKSFFHPQTLKEILSLVAILKEEREYFILACLLGILHHQRPGFLSYPASHLVPYLRTNKFPKEKFSKMYRYRSIEPRLKAKIGRVYKKFPDLDGDLYRECIKRDASNLKFPSESISAIITSPPYMNALNYGRDNRLRLWFLGVDNFNKFDEKLGNKDAFLSLMERSLSTLQPSLMKGGRCILVIGEVRRSNISVNTANIVVDIALNKVGGLVKEKVIEDTIPDIRRARRNCKATKREWIVILKKVR
jgi:hypothetical protein